MRTKTLLLTAAVSAVGIATSLAQVYSVNAVGYVNVTVPANGPFAIIANPLNGTNNDLNTILPLPDAADGTTIYAFDTASQSYTSYGFITGLGWLPTREFAPGEAFFIQANNSAGSTLNLTFVGEVPQGHLVNSIAASPLFSLKSSVVPQSATLGEEGAPNTLNFPAEDGDTVYTFNVAGQSYESAGFISGVGWLPDPVIPVATGFFVQKGPGTVKTSWTRDFSVN